MGLLIPKWGSQEEVVGFSSNRLPGNPRHGSLWLALGAKGGEKFQLVHFAVTAAIAVKLFFFM